MAKGRTILDYNEATDDDMAVAPDIDHMQIINTSLQTDSYASTSSLNFYARQHICYSTYMLWQFRLSVCLSVTRVDQSKTA